MLNGPKQRLLEMPEEFIAGSDVGYEVDGGGVDDLDREARSGEVTVVRLVQAHQVVRIHLSFEIAPPAGDALQQQVGFCP